MTMVAGSLEKVHPLLIPEILFHLGPLLSTGCLTRAVLVCRTWYSVLTAQLWSTISVGSSPGGNGHLYKQEHLDALQQNLHFIRTLEIVLEQVGLYRARRKAQASKFVEEKLKSMLIQCQGLIRLKTNVLYEELFTTIDRNRETVVHFGFTSDISLYQTSQPLVPRLWHVLSDDTDARRLHHLRHLELKCIHIQPEAGHPALRSAFAKLCQRLETIVCISCFMDDWLVSLPRVMDKSHEKSDLPPWNLKQVKFGLAGKRSQLHIRFFKQCPFLEELTWQSSFLQAPDSEFLEFLARSRLKFLSVNCIDLSDNSLAKLVEHFPSSFTTLKFDTRSRHVQFDSHSITAAVSGTSSNLSLLSSYQDTVALPNTLSQQLLSSCVNLVHLDAKLCVDATDLLTGRWVASQLVRLELTIAGVDNLTSSDGFSRKIIYKQLSRLVSLEELTLTECVDGSSQPKAKHIDFSLRHGMGKLEKLERLRRLDISKLPGLKMGLQEGEWIRDHWPLLEYLDLEHFHKDQSTHDMMVIYLDKNRPKLKLSLSLVDANLKNHIEEMGLVEKCMSWLAEQKH
ncbi:hypothetical protein B0O80DRAFT_260466 [Mortierella sp. GBAus27b]|nr:hypothetical protein B0O80DRAFT_260466 [Mortierella sp. GBAus27b]